MILLFFLFAETILLISYVYLPELLTSIHALATLFFLSLPSFCLTSFFKLIFCILLHFLCVHYFSPLLAEILCQMRYIRFFRHVFFFILDFASSL